MPYINLEKIQIGPVSVYTWGVFLVSAFLFAFFSTLRGMKNKELSSDILIDAFSWLIIGTVIGARLGYILQFPDYYFAKPIEILKIWQGGLTFHGGLFGLLVAALVFAKIKELSFLIFLQIADIVSLAAPIAIAIGRIGCSLVNDHMGKETSLPWGIVWPDGVVRHPVAEYLIISALILYLILRFLKPKLKEPGQLFLVFLFLYSLSRFFLDFFRTGELSSYGLSTAQWLSLAIILGIIILKVFKKIKELSSL